MNKLLPVLIVIALVVAGIGGYLMLSKQKPQGTSQTSMTQEQTAGVGQSLKDLIGMGTAQECTFSDEAGNGGTVYVGNSKMRGNFLTAGPQGSVNSHIIVDGQTTYMWMEGQPTGYKMTFDATGQAAAGGEAQNQSVDLNQKTNYNCKGWTVNSSLFALPAGVTFTDFGAMSVPSTVSESCATCDSLPETAKAACRETLGCN